MPGPSAKPITALHLASLHGTLHRLRPESIFPSQARTWIEVDLAAVTANARTIAARAPGARLLPMIKADAYGLGAVHVARSLAAAVAPWGFGVATAREGAELRDAGIDQPVVVFSPVMAELEELAARALTPALGSLEQVRAWFALTGQERPFHVQVDTGMSRVGFPWEAFAAAQSAFSVAPGFEGVFTHFHSADANAASVMEQLERFKAALATLPARPPLVHAANSAGALNHGDVAAFDLVRPGIFLYGGAIGAHRPQPVVSWRARIVEVNRRKAGATVGYGATYTLNGPAALVTLAAGYADGVRRSLSSRGEALIGGQRCAIAGRVSMDLTVVAAANLAPAAGEVATLVGKDGGDGITVDEMAMRAGTISYEILTGIGRRVPRVYV